MSLQTVQDFINEARVILQDEQGLGSGARYPDVDFVSAINIGILEFRRIRPDLFIPYLRITPPSYSLANRTQTVAIDDQYRNALLWYVCGHIQIRDDETTQDQRATIFLNKAVGSLTKAGA
jgi:hypothetical protein